MLAVLLLALAAVLVVTGCALVSPALAFIVAGLCVGAFALLHDDGKPKGGERA